VAGSVVTADPGNGQKTWSTDFKGAERASVKAVLDQILKMRPFLTDHDLAQERKEQERLERALTGIAQTIKDGPDTGGGLQLRRFLWSLYNGHHLVNLWRMTCALDATRGAWLAEVCRGAFVGVLKEDDIKRALLVAGEMQRWDDTTLSDEHERDTADALDKVESALRSLPPCRPHTDLNQAREFLMQAKAALKKAKAPDSNEGEA
jgi:hypothetical protein